MRALRLIGLAGVVSAALATSGGATTPGADGLIVFAQEVKGHYQLFTIRLHGTHLLLAGATGAGKGSYLWGLIRAMLPRPLAAAWSSIPRAWC